MKHYIFDKALIRIIKSEVLKWGILPSLGHLAMFGDTSDCHKWGSVLLVSNGKWVKDIATHYEAQDNPQPPRIIWSQSPT